MSRAALPLPSGERPKPPRAEAVYVRPNAQVPGTKKHFTLAIYASDGFKWQYIVNCHIYTARRSYASAVLGVVILSVCLSVHPSVCHTRAL